jgi:hypothetical protein
MQKKKKKKKCLEAEQQTRLELLIKKGKESS